MATGINAHSVGVGLLSIVAAACSASYDEDGDTGISALALLSDNALNMNALNMNALNMNGLELSALSAGALAQSNLAALRDPTSSGDLARQLVRYAVSCAFSPSQSFSFSWTDSLGLVHAETYWGLLALEPDWESKRLSGVGQKWVSACLASRVNWYGIAVSLSARGPTGGLNVTDTLERSTYTHEEGAFWGNLFGSSPELYACSYVPNDSYSRLQLRDCAAGHIGDWGWPQNCGMIRRLGSCSTYCAELTASGQYHPRCTDASGNDWNTVITIFLR